MLSRAEKIRYPRTKPAALEWCGVGTKSTRAYASADRAAGFFTATASWTLKPLRTDSVSRGRSISLFTRETIFLSFSIWLSFFMKRPFFER